jgi:CBS domain-containing protein
MKIRYVMSSPVRTISSTESIADAAVLMADMDIGVLPVVDDGRLAGIVTDRDLAVRGLAAGLPAGAAVDKVMTDQVTTCGPDDDLADVLDRMREEQVRRLPVCTAEGDLVGLISIADAAGQAEYGGEATEALARICRPHGLHCQAWQAA